MGPSDDVLSKLRDVPDPLALLAGFFANSPVAFQLYRSDGHCVLVNVAFRLLFGSEPPPDYNVLHDEIAKRQGVLDFIHRSFAGETISLPAVWYDARELEQVKVVDGRRVAIAATFFPLKDAGGRVSHVAIAFKDQTAEALARDAAESGRTRAERDLGHFLLFILFFPHLVAGPIVRARDFLPQVPRTKRWSWERAEIGLRLILLG